MKKYLAVISAIAVLGFVASANADQVQGTIAKIDQMKRIVLANGSVFKIGTTALGPTWQGEAKLRVGDEVKLHWDRYERGYMEADQLSVIRRK
jgi:hypothetical protein